MKFVLLLVLLAFYSATPTLGLKCYKCGDGLDIKCADFEKLSPEDKKKDANTHNCLNVGLGPPFCVTGTEIGSNKKVVKSCMGSEVHDGPKLKEGCENTLKKSGDEFKVCACDKDYCNLAGLSQRPSMFILGAAAATTIGRHH